MSTPEGGAPPLTVEALFNELRAIEQLLAGQGQDEMSPTGRKIYGLIRRQELDQKPDVDRIREFCRRLEGSELTSDSVYKLAYRLCTKLGKTPDEITALPLSDIVELLGRKSPKADRNEIIRECLEDLHFTMPQAYSFMLQNHGELMNVGKGTGTRPISMRSMKDSYVRWLRERDSGS